MNYIFIIIVVALIIFWIMNDLFNFFEFFNAGICTTSDGTFGNFYDNTCHPLSDSNAPSSDSIYTSTTTGEKIGTWTNTGAGSDATHPAVALQGRVPVRVIGTVRKGDRLVSAGAGLARAANKTEITAFNVIGRSLETKTTTAEGTIEAIVKLNS